MNNIVLTYIAFFSYFGVVVGLGELAQRVFKVDSDVIRKIEHILTAPVWILMYFLCWPSYHVLIISGVASAALGFIAFTPIFKGTRTSSLKMSYGVFYFGVAAFIVTAICYFTDPDLYPLVGLIYFTLSLADGFAPLVAKLFKNHNYIIRPGKSLAGCLTVIIISFLVAFTFNVIFNFGFSFLFLLAFATVIFASEYYGYKGTDNLFIVFFGYGYLMLGWYGLNNLALELAIIFLPPMILLNSKTKSLSEFAILFALAFTITISFCAGLPLFLLVMICYFTNFIIVKIVKTIRKKKGLPVEEHKTRRLHQIVANALPCMVFAILYYIFKQPAFIIAGAVSVIEELADSMASDVGRYCKRKPIDICRFKVTEPGLSGGISWLGTLIALVSCFAMGAIGLAFELYTPLQYVFLSLLAFVGMIIDSILGSLVQVKYICTECGVITEAKMHCDKPTVKKSGLLFVNNSVVNLLAGFITAGITFLLLITKVL